MLKPWFLLVAHKRIKIKSSEAKNMTTLLSHSCYENGLDFFVSHSSFSLSKKNLNHDIEISFDQEKIDSFETSKCIVNRKVPILLSAIDYATKFDWGKRESVLFLFLQFYSFFHAYRTIWIQNLCLVSNHKILIVAICMAQRILYRFVFSRLSK